MAVDPYDPWGDPDTVPEPGAYSYRTGADTSGIARYTPVPGGYTSQQVTNVGLAAAAYPWVRPGVAIGAASAPLPSGVVDASLADSMSTDPTPSKRRAREMRRKLRQANNRLESTAKFLTEYGSGRYSPETPGWQMYLEALGVYGGNEKEDRANALVYANNLLAMMQNADNRTVMRFGSQLRKLDEQARARDGGDGSLGEFVLSPALGALQVADMAISGGIAANDKLVPKSIQNQDPLIPGTNDFVRNSMIALQAPLDLMNASIRDFAYDISQSPETLGVLAENNKDSSIGDNWNNLLEQTYAYQAWVNGKATGDGLLPSYDKKVEVTKIVDGKEVTVKEESAAAAAGRRARELYPEIMIGDHAWTPGRALADLVADPDDMAFAALSGLVDGTIAFVADPTNAGLAAFAAARARPIITATQEGADAMKAAGAINGLRRRVNVQTARQWILNEGTPIIKAFRSNAENVLSKSIRWEEAVDLSMQAFPELPLDIHKRLAGVAINYAKKNPGELAPDSAYIDELYRVLGTEIRNPLNTNRVVGGRFVLGSKSKMWATLPPKTIDPGDPEDAIRGVNAAAKWIDAPDDVVRNIRLQIIRSAGSPAEKESIARSVMMMYEEAFVAAGMNRTWAQQMTQLVLDNIRDSAVYDIDEAGLNVHMPFLKRDPVTQLPLSDPTLLTEMRNSSFPLPDMRLAKRIVSGFGEFLNFEPMADVVGGLPEETKAFKAMASSIDAMDSALGVWKQLVLMRPAWGLRVVAEEQLRMAANGNASFFRSPLSALAWVLGSPMDANVEKRIKNAATAVGAVAGGVYGAQEDGVEGAIVGAAVGGVGGRALAATRSQELAEGFQRAKTNFGRGTSGIRVNKDATAAPSFFDLNEFDEFAQSQYGGFRNMEPSRAAKVRTHIFDSVLRTDPKAAEAYAEELMRVGSDPVVRAVLNEPDIAKVKDEFWSGELSKFREFLARAPDRPGVARQWSELRNDRMLADQYIDYVVNRIQRVTNGNTEFLDVMKTGQWRGEAIGFRTKNAGVFANSDVYNNQEWIDAVNKTAPNKFRVERTITRTDAEKKQNLARIRKTFDLFFDALMPRPSNYLSRSPMFRQSYWQRIEELFPEMGTTARARVIEDAKQANLGKETLARFEAMNSVASPKATVNAKTADTLAKKFALDETKNLLYDLSEKSQFFDATRLIFPFGEAWKEIITRWSTLIAEHPNYIRRGQQTVQAARQMKVDEVTGLPDPGGIGMFHKDITTGQESFIYPLSGLLTDKLMGVPIPLVGSVQGLNLVGSGLPGIGPVVQIPVGYLLPNTPRYDTVRDILFPYGEPEGDGPADLVLETVMPAWSKKIVQAFKSPNVDRLQGNVVGAMMQYKLSTGEYDVNGPDAQDEIARLLKDSTEAGKQYMIIRGLAQSMMPSAPAPQFLVKQGPNLVIAAKIAQDYRKRAEKVGWDEAFEWLLETYGPDTSLLIAQARSEAQIPGLSSKTDQLTWERNHPDLVNRYPEVWTMFAPNTGEFDIGAYTQEFERGQRKSLTPEEMLKEANNRLARHVYNRQRDALEADGKMTDNDTAQLKKYRDQLMVDFPGYDPYTFQNRTPILVEQLRDASKDPALARTSAGKAMADYFVARTQAENEASRAGVSLFGTSQKGKAIRDRLFAYGDALRLRVPDFGTAWDEVFVYEFKDR